MRQFIFAEYSEIFTSSYKEDILEKIKEIDFEFACKILSVLGHYQRKDDRTLLNSIFISLMPEINRCSMVKYLQNKDLISRHGVLIAWKYVLANNINCSYPCSDTNIGDICKLILKMHEDHMKGEINDDNSFIVSNAFFNYYDSPSNQLARAYYIFVKNKYNKSNIDIASIKLKFHNKYNISIEEYIYLISMVIAYLGSHYEYKREIGNYFTDEWRINPYTLPGVSEGIIPQLIKLLDQLSFDYKEGNSWSKEHLLEPCEFSLFVNKPLIKLNNSCYIPIERKIFEDLLFNSLFHKINDCYENGDCEFISDFGLMFQEYVEEITSKVCDLSQEFYKMIWEFPYGKEDRRSPDVMILHEDENVRDTVLVVEVKSARTLYDVNNYLNIDSSTINSSINKLVFRPLLQSIKAISDIVSRKCNSKITEDKVYYFLSVTMNNLPYSIFDANKITKEIKEHYTNLKIRGYNSISIEEFELFLQVLIFPKAKPFGWYLEKFCTDELLKFSFKNFIKDFPKAKDIEDINEIYYDPVTILVKEAEKKARNYFLKG
jgi:hypothetical protein